MTFKLRTAVDMHGMHTHARFDDLDLEFENVGKPCHSCLYFSFTDNLYGESFLS